MKLTKIAIIILACVATLNSAAMARPIVHPGPEVEVQLGTDVQTLLSNSEVLAQMHTLAKRHGMSLDKITVRRLSTELSVYTFNFIRKQGNFPPASGSFSARAGGGFTGLFTVVQVSEIRTIEPAICPTM